MATNSDIQGGVPADGSGRVSLANLVAATADEPAYASSKSDLTDEYAATQGRVGVVTSTDNVFVGDGSSWIAAEDFSLTTVAVDSQDVTAISSPSQGDVARHDGTGDVPETLARYDGSNWVPIGTVSFAYTGDGETGRTLAGDWQFEQVVIEETGGSAVDAYAVASNGLLSGGSFTGDITVESDGGLSVGDGGSDADPNTDGENYDVIAR